MQQITDDRLEAQVGAALLRRKWTIATAESCTGGLISHLLTNIPGSSAYVMGGVVTYSYESKVALLDVQWGTLDAHGAVSEEVAVEMARGARALFDVDLAVSVTGIAGPGGGTPEKPVGLAWFAATTRTGGLYTYHQVAAGDREAIKQASAEAALRLALRVINDE